MRRAVAPENNSVLGNSHHPHRCNMKTTQHRAAPSQWACDEPPALPGRSCALRRLICLSTRVYAVAAAAHAPAPAPPRAWDCVTAAAAPRACRCVATKAGRRCRFQLLRRSADSVRHDGAHCLRQTAARVPHRTRRRRRWRRPRQANLGRLLDVPTARSPPRLG